MKKLTRKEIDAVRIQIRQTLDPVDFSDYRKQVDEFYGKTYIKTDQEEEEELQERIREMDKLFDDEDDCF